MLQISFPVELSIKPPNTWKENSRCAPKGAAAAPIDAVAKGLWVVLAAPKLNAGAAEVVVDWPKTPEAAEVVAVAPKLNPPLAGLDEDAVPKIPPEVPKAEPAEVVAVKIPSKNDTTPN